MSDVACAKGTTLQATLSFLRDERDEATVQRVLERLPADTRAAIARAEPTDEIPFALALALWHAVDDEIGAADPDWMERAGARSIESVGVARYGGILRKSTPMEFLTQGISLFRLYYHPGDMEVVEAGPTRAVLRLVGFEAADPLFCRRQTGGLHRALTLARGERPSTRHVRCVCEGDAFCEWELRWVPTAG